jgi:hypothetical protein
LKAAKSRENIFNNFHYVLIYRIQHDRSLMLDFSHSKYITEVLVLKLRQVSHSRLIAGLLVGWTVFPVSVPVREEHISWRKLLITGLI